MKRLLEEGTSAELPVTPGTIADMKSLCLGLLEALHDKSLALIHQKKANRYSSSQILYHLCTCTYMQSLLTMRCYSILASRVTDLEQRLENGKKLSVFPSQILLENYCSADVDRQEVLDVSDINGASSEEKNEEDDVVQVKNITECTNEIDAEENAMKLPPQLQKLVDKALQELDMENGSQN